MSTGPRVAWAYELTKEQVQQELARRQVESDGTMATLRQRLVAYIRAHPEEYEEKPKDAPGYNEDHDRTRDLEELEAEIARLRAGQHSTPVRAGPSSQRPPDAAANQETRGSDPEAPPENSRVLDQMRKWNCHFDGRDLYAFLERAEELQHAYAFTDDQMVRGFPELLRGDAQLWHRNHRHEFGTLSQLKEGLRKFYLSPVELRHLDQQINNRKQGPGEKIRAFVTAVMTLMRRRGGYSPEQQLDTLYYNMRAEYRLHLPRATIQTTTELIQRAEESEETRRQVAAESSWQQDPRAHRRGTTGETAVAVAYDRSTCCWRCGQRGHSRFNCRNVQKRFCSHCGKEGILARDCQCPKTGNAVGAGRGGESARPPVS